jgi:hypothetical protein
VKTVLSVIFLPHGPGADLWLDMCSKYCVAKGYRVIAVVHEWRDVVHMLAAGTASVAVSGCRDLLPRDRTPRFEFVTEPESQALPPEQRRPVRRSEVR